MKDALAFPAVLALLPVLAFTGGEPKLYLGAADASAAVRLDDGTILVGDDEDNVLRLYDAEKGGPPRQELDVSSFLGLEPDEEADIEAAARIGDRAYWITSHSGSKHRQHFFAIRIERAGDQTVLRPVGRSFDRFLPALRRALSGVLPDADRAPLNVEGLARSPDGRSLWIALRSPLVASKAIVVPLANPAAVVDQGGAPELGQPLLWDLGGRGARDLLWSAARKELLVLVGTDDPDRPGLYRWSGTIGDAPRELVTTWPAGSEIQPEALVERAGRKQVLVLSDDGERRVEVPSSACRSRYDDRTGTCPNKRLLDPSRKSFRGFEAAP
jgi:Protein of unknown function (DUF3616)